MSAQPEPRVEFAPFAVEHLPEVLAIEKAVFSDPWSVAAFRHELADNRVSFSRVARLWPEGTILGYFVAWFVETEIHLGNLAVRPDRQGAGFGRRLLEQLISEGRSRGARVITLEVRESNLTAQRLYLRSGFRPVAVRRRYYPDNHEDAIVMMLDIPPAQAGTPAGED